MNKEKVFWGESNAQKSINQYLSEYPKLPDAKTYANLVKIAEEISELELRFTHVNKVIEKHRLKANIDNLIRQLQIELESSAQQIVNKLCTLVLMNETMHESTKKSHSPYIRYETNCKEEVSEMLVALNISVSKVDILYFNLLKENVAEGGINRINEIVQEFEYVVDDLANSIKSGNMVMAIEDEYFYKTDGEPNVDSKSLSMETVPYRGFKSDVTNFTSKVNSEPYTPCNLFYRMFVTEIMLANKIATTINQMHDEWPTNSVHLEESTILCGVAETLQIKAEVLQEKRKEKEQECFPIIKEFYSKNRTNNEWKEFGELITKMLREL